MRYRVYILCGFLLAALPVAGQQRGLTADDYARAEKFMSYNTTSLVYRSGVRPNWLADERLWYRVAIAEGNEFVTADPARGMRQAAFDHARLAAALSEAAATKYEPYRLPFTEIDLSAEGQVSFTASGKRWKCDVQGTKCAPEGDAPAGGRGAIGAGSGRGGRGGGIESLSPDRSRAVFIRDYNLWVRSIATGAETQLTKDGLKDYGYATDNAGWTSSDRPIVLWSPDSKKIATFQQDQRKVGEMYLVDTRAGHPTLRAWKYPLPGDEVVTMIERVVVTVDDPHVVRLQMPPDQHRSTLCDDITCRGGEWADVQWSPDGTKLAFVSTSRDHKREVLRIADTATGTVRDVLEETAPTYYESGNGRINWHYLPASNEVIWFSERDNWGHLYLYDLSSGKLKNRITSGDGNVTQVLRVDEKTRTIYFLGVGREKGRDPYFAHLYRIGFDGRNLALLTPEDANHDVTLSPSGRYFVDSHSKPDVPPVTVLRSSEGRLLATLEKADISKLVAAGWQPPTPITVKARDGQTDLHGLMYKPTAFDQSKKYPVINYIYPGPQTGSVGSRNFSPARGDKQALAELGFVVVEIDGMGTPWRSKKFHDVSYGDMGDNTLPDQVAGIKQLAHLYPWMDIDRVGIYGHSGGGFATASALFKYPDFYKVGVAQAGNHDNRVYEDDWGEKWQGLLEKKPDGTTNYDSQANQNFAKNLKGKLLLAHGTMDNNVPPNSTLLVVNELIRANKDFDLILFPNRGHGFGSEPYMIRRRWDYFVRHLLGVEPPQGYEMRAPAAGRGGAGQ